MEDLTMYNACRMQVKETGCVEVRKEKIKLSRFIDNVFMQKTQKSN